jgi:hypothetical protein
MAVTASLNDAVLTSPADSVPMQTLPSVANPSVLPVSYPAYFEVDVL